MAMILFVKAIADHCGRAEALRFCRHDDSCCKIKNQTILGDFPDRQGDRSLSRGGYATVSFLKPRGRKARARAKAMAVLCYAHRANTISPQHH